MNKLSDNLTTNEPVELGELEDSFGFLVRMTQVRVFEAFFNGVGQHELKPGEYSVLWIISLNPNVRQGDVARRLSIKPAHMTKVIQRLESRGFLTRHIPDNDRRSVRLKLTDEGQEFVDKYKEAYFTYYEMENSLSSDEMAQLTKLLQKFIGLEKGQS